MKLFKNRKTYYLYNPNTLDYERVYPSAKDRLFSVLRHLSTGIAFGIATFFIMMHVIDSPQESQLRKENKLLQTQYEVLDLRLNNAMEILDDIQQRDENLYRAIFQAESIPESVRKSGFGGTNRYKHLMELSNAELVVSTTQKMDMLRKQLYIQSNSLEELIEIGKNQEERANVFRLSSPFPTKTYGKRLLVTACVSIPSIVLPVFIQEWTFQPRLEQIFMLQVMGKSPWLVGNKVMVTVS